MFFSTRQDGEIHFEAIAFLDNGLEITAHVELEASTQEDQIDEHYLDVQSDWGLLRIGSDDPVSEAMFYVLPAAGVPAGGVDDPVFFYSNLINERANGIPGLVPDVGQNAIGGDANGVFLFHAPDFGLANRGFLSS